MAPTQRSDDAGGTYTSQFIQSADNLIRQHGTDIALVKQDLEQVKSRDSESRNAQHESWQRMEGRMTALERTTTDLAGTVDRWIEAQKSGDSKRMGSVQLWGYILALVGTLGMAWATYTASVAKSDMPAMLAKAVAEGLKAAGK